MLVVGTTHKLVISSVHHPKVFCGSRKLEDPMTMENFTLMS